MAARGGFAADTQLTRVDSFVLNTLLIAIAIQLPAQGAAADSIYATPALRAFVALAAEENKRVPAGLLSSG